jgi:DNA repair protein SbcD/Mre11
MKILHTSDWHLGKLFHAVNLVDDQRHVLKQVVAMVENEKPDAVIVAGDVFDRAVPSADAVELLDWVLTELVNRLATPTFLIAGNHDSPDRLQFGSRLLEKNGLHVMGKLDRPPQPIEVGRGTICAVPFVDLAEARAYLRDDRLATHEAALRAITDRFRSLLPTGAPSVLVAHAYVAGASPSDSERPLSVGGADQVAVDCFAGFTYTALGHLHCPQNIGSPRVRYSGSLLKFSRSEAGKGKSVSMVELGEDGRCVVRELPLCPRHDVREIQGLLADIEAGACGDGDPDDYLYVRLLDQVLPVNAMSRLRARFPNVVDVDVLSALAPAADPGQRSPLRELDDITLFDTFVKDKTGSGLSPEERVLVVAAIEAVQAGEGAS